MFIDLQRVPPEGQAVDRGVPAEQLRFDSKDFRLVSPVQLTGLLTPLEAGSFRFRGALDTSVGLNCVRCLEPFAMEVRQELDLVYLPQSANVGEVTAEKTSPTGRPGKSLRHTSPGPAEEGYELTDEDLAVGFYREERIDLRLLIWEQIYLALPMKPLCKQDCRGLCPHCGTNLNLEACRCVEETADPRLAILKTLLKS
ncbi:MAG: DUF177 domain-containing protein [Acidobacteriota bacterium]